MCTYIHHEAVLHSHLIPLTRFKIMRIIVDEQLAHMASDAPYAPQHLSYPAVAVQLPQGLDTADSSPRHYPYELVQPRNPFQQPSSSQMQRLSPHHDIHLAASASDLYMPSTPPPNPEPTSPGSGGPGANHYPASSSVPRLPPILQVEKQQVTTSATQLASASRRRNEAHFVCPVPGCGSTFTRRFNLRGTSFCCSQVRKLTPPKYQAI